MLRINNIKMQIGHNEEDIKQKVCKLLKLEVSQLRQFQISKKSIDARDKDNIQFVFSVDIEIPKEEKYINCKNVSIVQKSPYIINTSINKLKHPPVIIGTGPAGLFCALILAKAGLCPLIIEQGKDVDNRKKDIDLFWTKGILDVNSNAQFGEGGAGTFSDGKLNTGVNDSRIATVLEEFIKAGAPTEIAYTNKPHIGTDNLRIVVKNLRKTIEGLGGTFLFQTKFMNFISENNKLTHISIKDSSDKETLITTDFLVLAIGHSSRDTYEMLYRNGITMESKPFSVGVRIEHSQQMINKSQFGKFYNHASLGSADYKLSHRLADGRGVYTFCMCPGGEVVACSSEENMVVTNGMSYFARDLQNANSAILVSVTPKDFGEATALDGIYFQRRLESAAFELGGKNYNAPSQLVGDFLSGKKSMYQGDIIPTYKPGVTWADLHFCLDEFISTSIKQSLIQMDKKIQGFASYDAVLTGVESRSSSPVRILRNPNMQSNIEGIIPCGEGCGYAGGIMSSAIDGIKCCEAILQTKIISTY